MNNFYIKAVRASFAHFRVSGITSPRMMRFPKSIGIGSMLPGIVKAQIPKNKAKIGLPSTLQEMAINPPPMIATTVRHQTTTGAHTTPNALKTIPEPHSPPPAVHHEPTPVSHTTSNKMKTNPAIGSHSPSPTVHHETMTGSHSTESTSVEPLSPEMNADDRTMFGKAETIGHLETPIPKLKEIIMAVSEIPEKSRCLIRLFELLYTKPVTQLLPNTITELQSYENLFEKIKKRLDRSDIGEHVPLRGFFKVAAHILDHDWDSTRKLKLILEVYVYARTNHKITPANICKFIYSELYFFGHEEIDLPTFASRIEYPARKENV